MKKIFINEQIKILRGKDAESALEKENDSQFITDTRGITRVTTERWLKAQNFEKLFWMKRNKSEKTDRNEDHYQFFNGYKSLSNKFINSAIELGCGPFTNLRLIGEICHIKECVLLDPLIETYLSHPNCTYTRDWLFVGDYGPKLPEIIQKILSSIPLINILSLFKKIRKLLKLGLKIRISRIIPKPIEEMSLDKKFDLVIIINVIEHCYNVNLVFNNILSIMPQGSYLVFHDKYYEYKKVKNSVKNVYDAGHPLRVDKNIINNFLESNFKEIYKRLSLINVRVEDFEDSSEVIYFIGQKK